MYRVEVLAVEAVTPESVDVVITIIEGEIDFVIWFLMIIMLTH